MKTEVSISNKTIVRVVAIVIASYVALELAIRLRTQLIWLATALFLALALEPAVKRLSRVMPWRNRGLAVGCVLILLIAFLAFVGYALIPPFASQTYKLVVTLPHAYQGYLNANPRIARLAARTFHIPDTATALSQLSNQLLNYGGSAIVVIRNIGGGIFAVTTVLLLTLFMVLEGPHWSKVFWELTPTEKRDRWQPLVAQMHGTITGYVNGNLIKSAIAAIATAIILMILGSPYVLAL
ncbi:MAG TPA: AI-2E family transporter, partial [Burkholderiaceae bacterium]|nr:AI-2E family transporter [Burkholderiaceae bacterium]